MKTLKVGTQIFLQNRDDRSHDALVLLAIQDNIYYFQVIPAPLMADYWRVIGNDINKPDAIDPPGGPFLAVGDKLLGMTIKEIEKAKVAWTLTLEKNE